MVPLLVGNVGLQDGFLIRCRYLIRVVVSVMSAGANMLLLPAFARVTLQEAGSSRSTVLEKAGWDRWQDMNETWLCRWWKSSRGSYSLCVHWIHRLRDSRMRELEETRLAWWLLLRSSIKTVGNRVAYWHVGLFERCEIEDVGTEKHQCFLIRP